MGGGGACVGGGAGASGPGAPLGTKWGTALGEGTSRPARASGGRRVRPDPWDPRGRADGGAGGTGPPSRPADGSAAGSVGTPADGGTGGAGSPSRHARPSAARRWRRAPTDVAVQAAGMAAADLLFPVQLKIGYRPDEKFSLRDFHRAVNNIPLDGFLPDQPGGSLPTGDVSLTDLFSNRAIYSWVTDDISKKVIVICMSAQNPEALRRSLMVLKALKTVVQPLQLRFGSLFG